MWRWPSPLSAAVGSDGKFAAVVSRNNALIVMDGGRALAGDALPHRRSSPLVVGGRVFVLSADRQCLPSILPLVAVLAAAPGEPLIPRQAGVYCLR